MVQSIERPTQTSGGVFTCYPIGANAHSPTVRDVNEHEGLTYSKPVLKCQGGSWFQQTCGHGNWKWVWVPCGKWSCEYCHRRRIREEMIPEIQMALELAKERCQTLKFLTLTAFDSYLGGEPTTEGANRRRLDYQHLAQWVRRDGGVFEYLKVAELTKRGRVHTHALVIMPYIDQKALSVYWKKITGGSYVVDIEAVGMKCPRCWPGRVAPRFRRKKSMIIPPPGRGICQNCGYKPDDYGEVATYAAWEAGKYLCKALDQETASRPKAVVVRRVKKLSRRKNWPKVKKEKKLAEPCEGCLKAHETTFVGTAEKLAEEYPGLTEDMKNVAYYPSGGAPCECWINADWVGSKAFAGESCGLADMLLFLPEPSG